MLRTAIPLGGFGSAYLRYAWWLTQTKVLLMYLKLVVWPWPLLIHYQLPYLTTFAEAWMYVIPVTLLAVATLVLLWRNRPIGFLLTCGICDLISHFVDPDCRPKWRPSAACIWHWLTPCVLFVVGGYWLMSAIRQVARS